MSVECDPCPAVCRLLFLDGYRIVVVVVSVTTVVVEEISSGASGSGRRVFRLHAQVPVSLEGSC